MEPGADRPRSGRDDRYAQPLPTPLLSRVFHVIVRRRIVPEPTLGSQGCLAVSFGVYHTTLKVTNTPPWMKIRS